MAARAKKSALDISLASYPAVDFRSVRTSADNAATRLVYRNPFNGKAFSHDENYTEFHGRPGHARKVETQFGKQRITVQFSDGSQVTAVRDAFIAYTADLLPVITAANAETKECYAQAANKLQGFGRWIAKMAEYVSPTPRVAAPALAEDLPF